MTEPDQRLIEDYLPLANLSAIASTEKLHPRPYVGLVHYWPARRPTSASRAAIYATLVPAPRTSAERSTAASFVTKLAAYAPDEQTVRAASERITDHHGGVQPKVLDMFAGGGAIPLEAARLGCESHAIDYNPVAHLIELCTLVYPQTFGPRLADDFEHWSNIVIKRLKQDVHDLYPQVQIPNTAKVMGQINMFRKSDHDRAEEAEPVAYIWARTVPCRRPGCLADVPLVRQAWLRKKTGAVAAIPRIDEEVRLRWEIVYGRSTQDVSEHTKQTGAGQAVCIACNTPAPTDHVKEMAVAGRMSQSLAAVVCSPAPPPPSTKTKRSKKRPKLYLAPGSTSIPSTTELTSRLKQLEDELDCTVSNESLQGKLRDQLPAYGFERYRQLFTPRQLFVLATLIKHCRNVHSEMVNDGMPEDRALAIMTYFSMAFGRLLVAFNKFTRWAPQLGITMGALGDRQALKMVYDFSEINPFAHTQGCLSFAFEREAFSIRELSKIENPSVVSRGNAENLRYGSETFDAVITDPPYYSSIYYSDLSSFYYVWLKRLIGDFYPEHFALPLPPKKREAVAQPSQHRGDMAKAKIHYEGMMRRSFAEARRVLKPNAPLVCVYAHRTTEGWATLIRALVGAEMTVTEAWPIQTESRGRANARGAAALSDSIFFVARRRETSASGQYETDVQPELSRIADERVKTLWSNGTGIGGADLLMAAVGAGLRAYTRFTRVEYANGEPVPAETYLRDVEGVVLNTIFEQIFGLQDTAVDAVDALTRFYILWRYTYRELSVEAGEVYVFCYPQGIEMDVGNRVCGPPPALVDKIGGKYRVRTFQERGEHRDLGIGVDGEVPPLIDILHRVLWLLENQPTELSRFIHSTRPNREKLRLVAQALAKPILNRAGVPETGSTAESPALARLNTNWFSLMDGTSHAEDLKSKVSGQQELTFGGNGQ